MKAKLLTIFVIAAFLVLSINLVSATITFTSVPDLSKTGSSVDVKVISTENETISFSGLNDILSGGKTISFTLPLSVDVTENDEETINIDYVVEPGFNFQFGEDYNAVLTASGNVSTEDKSTTLSFGGSNFCENVANDGELSVNIEDITVTGFSDDDNEWYPLDEVEIEIDIENDGSEDIENVEVSWCLFDTENNECVVDDDESDFDLDEGDTETITISFTLDPDDLESDVSNYEFHVKATGEIKDGVFEGDDSCESDVEDIDVILGNDFVILDDINVQETLQCGAELQISADVWNIGEDDQDDVQVLIENRDLGIVETVEAGDIDAFENEALSVSFTIPETVNEGSHKIIFTVLDEDDDVYESEDDEESIFSITVLVDCGASAPSQEKAVISAILESGGKAGEDLIVRATVTNSGDETNTFTITATGYDDWAQQAPLIEPSVTILSAGESKDVLLTFTVNEDTSGNKTFNIMASPTQGDTTSRVVGVTIESSGGGFGITGFAINSENWYLWGIGALNVILVIIIIIVAIRVARS